MAVLRPTAGLIRPTGLPAIEGLLDRFEEAWQSDDPPRLEDFLPPTDDPSHRETLEELVRIDLEYRWRGDRPWALEDYVAHFPGLAPLPVELIGGEYWARKHLGDRPGHEEYLSRFAEQGPALRETLLRIDAEFDAEQSRGRKTPPRPAEPPPAGRGNDIPMVSVGDMLKALRQRSLLSQERLNELILGELQERWSSPRDLARHLIERGWLTPYQVNQIVRGRAAELVLGSYLLLERLGRGGAGQVFKARHLHMNRDVALKVIRPELLADPDVVARFHREIQVISQLAHPNLVLAHDAGPMNLPSRLAGEGGVRGTHFLVMEYVEGIALSELVKREGPLPADSACDFIRQAALGLDYVHGRGLVHRDIKPANLLVTRVQSPEPRVESPKAGSRLSTLDSGSRLLALDSGLIKILDLGLARFCHTDPAPGLVTPMGSVMMGTPDYLAPEQALDFHETDARADIYSLGCTFYYLLTGQPPFPGGKLADKLMRHQRSAPPPLEQFRTDLPAGLSAVVGRMLAKAPKDRYQTAGEVAAVLTSFLTATQSQPVSPSDQTAVIEPRLRPVAEEAPTTSRIQPGAVSVNGAPRRRRLLAGVALLLLLVPAGLFVASRLQEGQTSTPGPLTSDANLKPRSPLDNLDPEAIPLQQRFPGHPKEMVAILRLPSPDPAKLGVTGITFSPDDRILAFCHDRTLQLWDVTGAAPREQRVLHPSPGALSTAFAPDGKSLACGGTDGQVTLWDPSGTESQPKNILSLDKGPVEAVAFAPDGKKLAAASGASVSLWDLAASKESKHVRLAGHSDRVRAVAFVPGGAILATGSRDRTVRLWDLRQDPPKELAVLREHRREVNSLAFTPDGKMLTTGSQDARVRLWEMGPTGARYLTLYEAHSESITVVVFSPDGRTLASADASGRVILWEIATGAQLRSWSLMSPVVSMAMARDGRHLATGNGNGMVLILRLPSP